MNYFNVNRVRMFTIQLVEVSSSVQLNVMNTEKEFKEQGLPFL